jgi:NitT/TauT family transport system ATP-binding protein
VDQIHDAIVSLALPDEPAHSAGHGEAQHKEAADAAHAPASEKKFARVQSIPNVPVGRIVGLLEVLEDSTETVDIFELSAEIGKEFGETIAIVKAAEMLDLVDTPKHDVHLTELGRQFLAVDSPEQKQIFARQAMTLRLFQIIVSCLQKAKDERVDADVILEQLAVLLPYDKPEQLFDTLIAWGRYAELIDYDQDTHSVYMQQAAEPKPAAVQPAI